MGVQKINVGADQLEYFEGSYSSQLTFTYILAVYFHNKTKTSNRMPDYILSSAVGLLFLFQLRCKVHLLGVIEHRMFIDHHQWSGECNKPASCADQLLGNLELSSDSWELLGVSPL